jgi:hypothetical protein
MRPKIGELWKNLSKRITSTFWSMNEQLKSTRYCEKVTKIDHMEVMCFSLMFLLGNELLFRHHLTVLIVILAFPARCLTPMHSIITRNLSSRRSPHKQWPFRNCPTSNYSASGTVTMYKSRTSHCK